MITDNKPGSRQHRAEIERLKWVVARRQLRLPGTAAGQGRRSEGAKAGQGRSVEGVAAGLECPSDKCKKRIESAVIPIEKSAE